MIRFIVTVCAVLSAQAGAQVLYEIVDLTEGSNETFTRARAINNSPRVVGWAELGDKVKKGLMWKDGQVLFELLELPKDFSTGGFGLNDNDVAAGFSEELKSQVDYVVYTNFRCVIAFMHYIDSMTRTAGTSRSAMAVTWERAKIELLVGAIVLALEMPEASANPVVFRELVRQAVEGLDSQIAEFDSLVAVSE